MSLAKNVRRRSVGANQFAARSVQGDAFARTAATPASVTLRSCGEIFAQFKYVTSCGISNRSRWQAAVMFTGPSARLVMVPVLKASAVRSALLRDDGRRGRQRIPPNQSGEAARQVEDGAPLHRPPIP